MGAANRKYVIDMLGKGKGMNNFQTCNCFAENCGQ